MKTNYFINSLARGLQVLSTFTTQQPRLTISEIAKKTGLNQSTVFRLVYTLEHLGYLIRDNESRKYQQSVRMLTLSLAARESLIVRSVALPIMEELSDEVNEPVKLAVLDGVEIVFIGVVDRAEKLTLQTPLGFRSPAYCTALGKSLLAYLPDELLGELVSQIQFDPKTDNTILDSGQLNSELETIRREGYACQDQEYIPGLSAIAAPIFDFSGDVVAAINLSGLSAALFSSDKKDFYIQALVRHAQKISESLGFQFPVQRIVS